MWQQYKKTFLKMQILMTLAVLAIYLLFCRAWTQLAVVYLVMQIGAFIGAGWAARLRAMVEQSATRLPLESRR